MDSELIDLLKLLATKVQKTIDNGLSDGSIQPENKEYRRWKVDKFQYTDEGIIESDGHDTIISELSWSRANIKIRDIIKNCPEFNNCLEKMCTLFDDSNLSSSCLENLVGDLTDYYLHNSKCEDEDIEDFITILFKNLNEEPVKYGAVVKLAGIILKSERVDIADGISIRQPKREDLEMDLTIYNNFNPFPEFSTILNIEFQGKMARDIQRKVHHAIALLRLFKVGSVKYISYKMYTDSLTDFIARGEMSSNNSLGTPEKYIITSEDELSLKKFWKLMSDYIPENFYEIGITEIDHKILAYNRYSDALLQNGVLDKRIADVIMGLEALYLKPDGEMQELAYRLRIRISKLLGSLGYDPLKVKEIINDAYGIRSTFLHGGHLNDKKTKKLEAKYKDSKILLYSILDYLRISIIMMILLPEEKVKLIDLIDDSLIDNKKEKKLRELIQVTSGVWDLMK